MASRAVYVAGSSAEIERAEKWIAKLREAGVTVTSTWCETIRKVGDANPREATREQRQKWVREDLRQVLGADVVWMLVPSRPSFGASWECGYASGYEEAEEASNGIRLVFSGDTKSSIFTSVGEEFATDEEAFARVVEVCR